jgi:hypothetical protein
MNNEASVLGAVTDFINPNILWFGVKIMFLIGIGIFILFSLSIFRQTQLMDKVLKIEIRPSFKTIALVYLGLIITYFFLAFLVL